MVHKNKSSWINIPSEILPPPCPDPTVWAFFGIAFLRDWNENWPLSQSCGHCWVLQICWHIECSTFTASSCRIWYSSTGITSPPLALFIVMLPKAHLTSHSRMSGPRWVITPSWLSGSWRSFLYSSVYSYHLFLISSASVRFIPFLSFIVLIFAWNVPLVSLIFFSFIFISWRLITSQHLSGFCHTLTWISHGVTCIPHPDPTSHFPLHPIPLGLPSAPAPSTCLMHSTWAGDLFHYR